MRLLNAPLPMLNAQALNAAELGVEYCITQ